MKNHKETAVFGGGCFWCTEAIFKNISGVSRVSPGYAGGKKEDPTYDDVCQGDTGHAEVIKIEFDAGIISFETLLEVFFDLHDPTTPNRQGADAGTQYRSIILYTTREQKIAAEKAKLNIPGAVTEIKELEHFYNAEEYHINYYGNNKENNYCRVVILPKLEKLKEKYGKLVRPA